MVLFGEESHGTSEFYRARAAITRRLIEEHGFTIVAVEADWPDAAAVNRYVTHQPARDGAEPPFTRFRTWMWRNTDVEAFIHCLRGHNEAGRGRRRASTGSTSTTCAALSRRCWPISRDRPGGGAHRPRAVRLPDAPTSATRRPMAAPC